MNKLIGLLICVFAAGCVLAQEQSAESAEAARTPVSPGHSRLFASVWGANYISVSDTASMREIKRIPADNDGPATSYVTKDNRRLYLENGGYRGRTVSIVDPQRMMIDHQIPISGANGDRATRIRSEEHTSELQSPA